MVDQRLVNYFKEGISKGYSIESLKKQLIDSGQIEFDVEEAAGSINSKKEIPKLDDFKVAGIPRANETPKLGSLEVKGNVSGKRPGGVAVVSILHWLIALGLVASGVIAYISFETLALVLGSFGDSLQSLSLILFLVFLIFSLLPLFTGIGIWKGRNGWRVVALVFGILFLLLAIFSLVSAGVQGILGLLIPGYIVGYLFFSKKGKAWFKK